MHLFLAVRQWLSQSHSTWKLHNLCLPIPLLFSLILFRFYPFSLIVCNSYQVSLRPTSAASRSAASRAKCLLSAFYWLPGRRVVVVQCNLGTPITGFNKSSCFLMVVKPLSSFPHLASVLAGSSKPKATCGEGSKSPFVPTHLCYFFFLFVSICLIQHKEFISFLLCLSPFSTLPLVS